jgi:hypothetical protein
VDDISGLPVEHARVVLVRESAGYRPSDYDTQPTAGDQDPKADRLAVLTSDDGRFRFRLEGPVKFHLLVDAPGYIRPWQGISPENEFEASAEAPKTDIAVRVTRELAISGRITDHDNGKPLAGLRILPFRYRSGRGGRVLWPDEPFAETDAEGRFKIERLGPGNYYLQVIPAGSVVIRRFAPADDGQSAAGKSYQTSWYPGVTSVGEALPVRLGPGIDLAGVDFRIAKEKSASARGQILGDGSLRGDVELALSRVTQQLGGSSEEFVTTASLSVGSCFEISHLAPGVYWLNATGQGPDATYSAGVTIQLGTAEQHVGLNLYLQKGVAVSGRIRVEGRQDDSATPTLSTEPVLSLTPLLHSGVSVAHVDARRGTFILEGVALDQYVLKASSLPSGYAVSEVRYNGSVCPHGIISLAGDVDEHHVELTLSPANGAVFVSATDHDDPAPGATVLIVPEPVDDQALLFKLRDVKANRDGRVTISALLPGIYRVLSYRADVNWGEDTDLKQHLVKGTEVRVSQTQTAAAQVPVCSFP